MFRTTRVPFAPVVGIPTNAAPALRDFPGPTARRHDHVYGGLSTYVTAEPMTLLPGGGPPTARKP